MTTLLAAIALLHVFWALGGRWGAEVAVPEVDGRPTIRPGVAATLIVAALLVLAATLIALRAGVVQWAFVPRWIPTVGTWVVGAVFLLRSIGDFRLAGFFKRHRGTRFARLDTTLYSPLCLLLATGCLIVAVAR